MSRGGPDGHADSLGNIERALKIGSSLFSMESSGANGGQPGDSSNSELPCALQTLARPARIAWWRWSPQNLKGSERLAGGRAQRYHRKASQENIASWRDASPEGMPSLG